jgi:L-ascorbate metabolism protein UlaG (beta-lactamase superfamily)
MKPTIWALLRRSGTVLLFVVIALCFAPTLVPPFLDRIYYEGPQSDHFDGERFFNPGAVASADGHGSPARFFNRWLSGDERAEWPEHLAVRPTVPPRIVAGKDMLVTWIGHSTVLIQTQGLNILTDPIWSKRASPFSFIGPKRVRAPGVRLENLPKIHFILVSHNHYDHLDLPTLKRLGARDNPTIVTSLGNEAILRPTGLRVLALDWGGRLNIPGRGAIRVERNQHWSSRWGTDRNRALWSAFTIETPGGNIFYAGDTGWGDGRWVEQAATHGPFRLAIIPIGAYEPRDFMKSNHIDPAEAVAVFERLNPAMALGVHWGTFQLTFEAIDDPPRRLEALKRAKGIAAARFVATEVGRSFWVPADRRRQAGPMQKAQSLLPSRSRK